MGKINFALLNCSAANYSPVNVSGAGFTAGGGKKSYTVAELCAMGYGVATDYGYNMKGDFAAAGVPIPTDLAARLAGEDGVLLKVTGLKADADFWEAVRQALASVTVQSGALPGYFQGTNMGGAVEMTVDAGSSFSAEDMLNGSQITSLTLSGTGGYFSSGHWAFRRCGVVSVTTDTPVLCQDCSGMYEWCGKLESPASVRWGDRLVSPAYPEGASNVDHMFDSCAALAVVPQYGDDREADANTLRPSRAYGFIGLSGVETLGPVLDLRYIDPADADVCTLIFPSGDSLTDARLQNLNHGDWWLDGTTGTGGVSHGNLSNLDAESVAYLMAHLWDLSTDKTGKNWRTVENSWNMWIHDQTIEFADARAVVNFLIAPTGQNASSWLRTNDVLNEFKFRVTGLAEGDRLEFGTGVVAPSEASIYKDGEYVISKPYGLRGFKLYNDTETGYRAVTLEIVEHPYDAGNHLVDAAALHVPESWREKMTTDMLASAAAKGWSVWIGEENLTAGLPSIFDSLVLWYDIAKQGATNETMDENPVLKDLSGHGHDATCYNFGWAGMSGIGGYSFSDLESWIPNSYVRLNVITPNKVTILGGNANSKTGIRTSFNSDTFIKIRVEGSSSDNILNIYRNGDNDGDHLLQSITEDNVYVINVTYNNDSKYQQLLFAGDNITIEQLPQYPGSLVSDGVDDYAYVDGLPILTNEKGFTVIAKRKWIGDPSSKSQGFVSKGSTPGWVDGAFYFECVEGNGVALFNRVFSGIGLSANYITSFTENDVTYLTSKKYNDSEIENIGDGIDTDRLVIFRLGTTINNFYSSIAIYSLLLFNRDLTDEEIEWVKNNLIENNTEA